MFIDKRKSVEEYLFLHFVRGLAHTFDFSACHMLKAREMTSVHELRANFGQGMGAPRPALKPQFRALRRVDCQTSVPRSLAGIASKNQPAYPTKRCRQQWVEHQQVGDVLVDCHALVP